MTNNLYCAIREYHMMLASSCLVVPLSSLTAGEDFIFRDFGKKLIDKRLRKALRRRELCDVVMDSQGIAQEQLAMVFACEQVYGCTLSQAKYLDERIRSHPTKSFSDIVFLYNR